MRIVLHIAPMIRRGTRDDLPALRALFEHANDAPYDLAAVAEEKCFDDGIAGAPHLSVFVDEGSIRGAAVSCGKWLRLLAVDRAHRRKGIGSALLAASEERGVRVIAAEPGNYFVPGVLRDDAGSRQFLLRHGYAETQSTHNLEVGLPSRDAGAGCRRAEKGEAERVLHFIETHFGRIWRFEAAKAFDRDLPTMFIAEADGEVSGFAAHDVNNRGLGFFGPTGVSAAMRGRGIGCALLLASLADLRRLGHARAVIPWTDALEFYRRCSGAEPAHRFVAFAKPEP